KIKIDTVPGEAPTVVERPNDWAKTMKSVEGLNDTEKLKLEFWQSFNETMKDDPEFNKYFRLRKPQVQHWYDLSLGTSAYYISMNINTQKKKIDVGLYIPNDKDIFKKFHDSKDDFDKALDCNVEFRDAGKASRILIDKSIDITRSQKWSEAYKWFLDNAIIFKSVAKELDK
ncbi:MAG: DUF4268 domain-containing protein, partial [Bacteroidales bacterium]|nr:DUF4268 domain-containing protein [Bacteroidales bacterium]